MPKIFKNSIWINEFLSIAFTISMTENSLKSRARRIKCQKDDARLTRDQISRDKIGPNRRHWSIKTWNNCVSNWTKEQSSIAAFDVRICATLTDRICLIVFPCSKAISENDARNKKRRS
jgi:hypothetical protein